MLKNKITGNTSKLKKIRNNKFFTKKQQKIYNKNKTDKLNK